MRHAARSTITALALLLLASLPCQGRAQVGTAPEPGQQVVLVTGSTSGLGREVALRMGARGAHVIVHGRDAERGAAVVDEINTGPGSARFYAADFSSFENVHGLAEAVLSDYDRLDVLVNNAGFGSAPDERWVSEDGHEFRFQINYLAPFLLTNLLKERIVASAPSRIVNVSSLAQAPIDWNDVMIEKDFSGRRAYGQSKLAQIGHTFDLHDELGGSGVIVNALHPATYMPTGMSSGWASPRARRSERAPMRSCSSSSATSRGGSSSTSCGPSGLTSRPTTWSRASDSARSVGR